MYYRKHPIYCVFYSLSFACYSQQSYIDIEDMKSFDNAVELYQNKSYKAALKSFKDIEPSINMNSIYKTQCNFYITSCAIDLNDYNADELIEFFIKDFPTNIKINRAYLNFANSYFNNEKYESAIKWYTKVKYSDFPVFKDKQDYLFKLGYSYFVCENYSKAYNYFSEILDSKKYGNQAKYYAGYSSYRTNNYITAEKHLKEVADYNNYRENVTYYLIDINFKSGEFKKAIDLSVPLFEKVTNSEEKLKIAKIIGESYFNLEQYTESIPYLESYKNSAQKWTNRDYYQLGYAYYKKKDCENAIVNFNKIIGGVDAISQNAYYHLAQCYLNLGQKSQALNAFKSASQMKFDSQVREDSWFNYAKLSYDIGNPYISTPEVLKEYLNTFPKSLHKTQVKGLIANAYINIGDYKGALIYLEDKKNQSDRLLYDKTAFLRAIELFNLGDYINALHYFSIVAQNNLDITIATRAIYWKAESNYHLNNYNEALVNYELFNKSPNKISCSEREYSDYNIAYTYFKLKEYKRAIDSFKSYINSQTTNAIKLNDSYMRLADVYFITREYKEAIENYEKAIQINNLNADYAYYQKALCYGFIGDNNYKIKNLTNLIATYDNSQYLDHAYYTLAETYNNSQELNKAITVYEKLIETIPNSSIVPNAKLKKGLILYNTGKNEEALDIFKDIVQKYPNTSQAKQATTNIRNIYIDLSSVDMYANWAKSVDFIDVTNEELSKYKFESAEKKYIKSKYSEAIESFKEYLNQFPKSTNSLAAHFYLAQSYYYNNQKEKSTYHFKYIIESDRNDFTEQALLNIANIYIENEQWNKAISVLDKLESETYVEKNKIFATRNLLIGYYSIGDYTNALNYCDKILNQDNLDTPVKIDALIIMARSAIKNRDQKQAETAYKTVEDIAKGDLKAEALYYSSYFKNKKGLYKESNKAVEKLASEHSTSKEWGAKGLIIMAKNFYSLGDSYQATFILKNVIDNFSQFENIVKEAQEKLNQIKTNEAKTNASVIPDE